MSKTMSYANAAALKKPTLPTLPTLPTFQDLLEATTILTEDQVRQMKVALDDRISAIALKKCEEVQRLYKQKIEAIVDSGVFTQENFTIDVQCYIVEHKLIARIHMAYTAGRKFHPQALALAAELDNYEVVKLLIAKGVKQSWTPPNVGITRDSKPMYCALDCVRSDSAIIKLFKIRQFSSHAWEFAIKANDFQRIFELLSLPDATRPLLDVEERDSLYDYMQKSPLKDGLTQAYIKCFSRKTAQ
jgi:hypothetical protein